jgi:hypothetical protein
MCRFLNGYKSGFSECLLSFFFKLKFDRSKNKLMKVLLDVKDNKAEFVMELLQSLSFVKAEPISASKARFLKELKQSIDEVNLAKQGKIKLKTAEELLNEL